jgi:small subunit ribosomal protein S16
MQRTGRKGQAQFRMIVQDSRRSPTSGNIVELLGSFDPHTKVANINKDRIVFFLNNGAQPSDRVLRILAHQKVVVPAWVEKATEKKSKTKNPDKLRKNQPPVEKKTEAEVVAPEAEVVESPEVVDEAVAEPAAEEVANEIPIEAAIESEIADTPVADTEADAVAETENPEPETAVETEVEAEAETEAPKE